MAGRLLDGFAPKLSGLSGLFGTIGTEVVPLPVLRALVKLPQGRHYFQPQENSKADWIEQSVVRVLQDGNRTPDLAMPGAKPVGTTGFMDILHVEMQRTLEHAERYGWGV